MTELTALGEAIVEYGFPLILSIFLIWYVYKNQKELNLENKEREKLSYERELDHRKFIDSLKNDLHRIACENNTIVKSINQDVDNVHGKIVNLGHDIDTIKVDVQSIKKDVDHIRFIGIHIAKDAEE